MMENLVMLGEKCCVLFFGALETYSGTYEFIQVSDLKPNSKFLTRNVFPLHKNTGV